MTVLSQNGEIKKLFFEDLRLSLVRDIVNFLMALWADFTTSK